MNKLSSCFIKNITLQNSNVQYFIPEENITMCFTDKGVILVPLKRRNIAGSNTSIGINWEGCSENILLQASEDINISYFIGGNKSNRKISSSASMLLKYTNLQKYVDLGLKYEGNILKFKYIISSGVVSDMLAFSVDGADMVNIDENLNLQIKTELGKIIFKFPEYNGSRLNYSISENNSGQKLITINEISPALREPATLELNIDISDINVSFHGENNINTLNYEDGSKFFIGTAVIPTIENEIKSFVVAGKHSFTTLNSYIAVLGGNGNSFGNAIAVDCSGRAYLTGYTEASDFPVSTGAYNKRLNGKANIFVTKLNASGTDIIYSTLLGGSERDFPYCITIDYMENVYIGGSTSSKDFPDTYGNKAKSCDKLQRGFIVKLNNTGNKMIFASLLKINSIEEIKRLFVDYQGNLYAIGCGCDCYPKCFLMKLDRSGSNIINIALLNDFGIKNVSTLTVDNLGHIYVDGTSLVHQGCLLSRIVLTA